MFVIKDLIIALLQVLRDIISIGFSLVYILLTLRILFSWLGIEYYYNSLVQAVYAVTEPILKPFRRLPLQIGMLDFSPIAAFIVLRFFHSFLDMVITDMLRGLL